MSAINEKPEGCRKGHGKTFCRKNEISSLGNKFSIL
jgi:hypothetical protein